MLPVGLLETGDHLGRAAERDRQRGVGPVVAEVSPAHRPDTAGADPLLRQLGERIGVQAHRHPVQFRQKPGRERCLHRHLTHRGDIRQPHPVGGQHPGQRVDENPGDAKRIGPQVAPYGVLGQGGDDFAMGPDPFRDLDDPRVHHLRADDLPVEDPWPVLVGDSQRVPESAGDDQDGRLALAFQQSIGRDRRAEAGHGDLLRRYGGAIRDAEHMPDTRDGGIGVPAWVLREQLVHRERAIRAPRDHVGERAAPVDPELPAAAHLCPSAPTARY